MAITAKELRKQSKKGNRQVCEACGEHESITENHHLLTLKKCALLINTGVFIEIKSPIVWLCPNCHMYLHQMMRGNFCNAALGTKREVYEKLKYMMNQSVECHNDYLKELASYEK